MTENNKSILKGKNTQLNKWKQLNKYNTTRFPWFNHPLWLSATK